MTEEALKRVGGTSAAENHGGVTSCNGYSVSSSDGTDVKVFDTEDNKHIEVTDFTLFPDGGLRAWTVVAASFFLVFCTFGEFYSSPY